MAYQEPHQSYAQGLNVTSQKWENSLCNCSPLSSCCLAFWCPCMLYGRTEHRLKDPSMNGFSECNSGCLLFGLITCAGCSWVLAWFKRTEVREKYGIEGGGCGDCCTGYCCACCVLIQNDNEVKTRSARGPITQGYQTQKEGMHMPPPSNGHQAPIPSPGPAPHNGMNYGVTPPNNVAYGSPAPNNAAYSSPAPNNMAYGSPAPSYSYNGPPKGQQHGQV
jgi:Cys-rich protein (TIGR01571 family)